MTQDFQEQTDGLVVLDHTALKEILVSQEVQVVLEAQEQKAAWEKWDSQAHQDRRVVQVSQVCPEVQDNQEHLVSLELKVNPVLLELGRLVNLD